LKIFVKVDSFLGGLNHTVVQVHHITCLLQRLKRCFHQHVTKPPMHRIVTDAREHQKARGSLVAQSRCCYGCTDLDEAPNLLLPNAGVVL
jgi:hypothetical protein